VPVEVPVVEGVLVFVGVAVAVGVLVFVGVGVGVDVAANIRAPYAYDITGEYATGE